MAKYNIRKSQVFHDFYSRLKMIAVSCYEWENLPPTCNARFLENTLFNDGIAMFVEDGEMSFLNTRCTPSGMLNHYNEPISYRAYSTGYNKDYLSADCVIVRNNYLEKSTESTLLLYAERLTRIQMAIDTNINAQKTPLFIRCDEKQKQTYKAIFEQYDGDIPLIIGSKALSNIPIESIDTKAPFVADKLREEKTAVWNEFLEFLGFNTNPADKKKERLITDEVNSNNEQIEIQEHSMLLCRVEACENFNKMYVDTGRYDKPISVKFRIDKATEMIESEEE